MFTEIEVILAMGIHPNIIDIIELQLKPKWLYNDSN